MGPLRCEHVFSNCAAVFSFLSYFSQVSNSLACRFRYCFRWTRFSFSSDTSLMVTAVSLASLSRSSIKEYRGTPHCPRARRFRALCHPSMSLFVLMACWYTLQFFGRNTALSIHPYHVNKYRALNTLGDIPKFNFRLK